MELKKHFWNNKPNDSTGWYDSEEVEDLIVRLKELLRTAKPYMEFHLDGTEGEAWLKDVNELLRE